MTLLLALALLLAPSTPDTSVDERTALALREAVRAYAEPVDAAFDGEAMPVEWVDLNDDDRLDALVYLSGAAWCGSNGCTLLVMEAVAAEDVAELGEYRPAAEISLVHTPLLVAETSSNGWRHLILEGADGVMHRLAFDGETYPLSPADGETIATLPAGQPVFVSLASAQ